MKYVTLGDSSLKVSEICLGTMTFGEQNTEGQAHEQLDYAFSRGVNFVDAAEMYPVPARAETTGRTESYVGSWLRKRKREEVILATKVTGPGRGFNWIRDGDLSLGRKQIRAAIEGSLRRLQTEYIDLYQIHWPDRYAPLFGKSFYDPSEERATVAIEQQLTAMNELIQEGKVRYLGLSNETPWGVLEFLKQSAKLKLPRVVSIQNAYNLLNRTYEQGLSEVTRLENIPLIPYSPLGFGHLAGKYLNGGQPSGARLTLFPPFGQRYTKSNVAPATAAYVDLAKRLGLSPATLALAFVRSKWFVASTIIGATTMEQLKENIDSTNIVLDSAASTAVDEIHLRYPNPAI